MAHAYPRELADFVLDRWPDPASSLPRALLVELLSTAYQATLLRDEERPVTFRVVLAEPAAFPDDTGPPDGLHRLELERPRAFNEHELRRMSPAAKYARALIGVRVIDGRLEIWGILQSGPRWLQAIAGGRGPVFHMPDVPIVRGMGPGRLVVARGSKVLAQVRGGQVTDLTLDVFESKWLPERFSAQRAELHALHEQSAAHATETWATVQPRLNGVLTQQMFKRVIATVVNARHGGTFVVLPPDLAPSDPIWRFLRLKYAFRDEAPRRRFRALVLRSMAVLAETSGRAGATRPVDWDDYRRSATPELARLDEAIFEISNLFGELAEVDGAVVLTKRFELLGFAAEIVGDLPEVQTVRRAVDLEGNDWEEESTDGVGTRHRSLYRLCDRFHDVVGVVVSQDGSVRFVAWKEGAVTYWDHVSLGSAEA